MWEGRGVVKGEIFWLLGFAAEVGVGEGELYEWGVGWAQEWMEKKSGEEQEEETGEDGGEVGTRATSEDRVLFMGVCLYYLVKNFLPHKE